MTPLSQHRGCIVLWVTFPDGWHMLICFPAAISLFFHSKVICAHDPSCIFAANSRVSAVKRSAPLISDPTLPHVENTTTPNKWGEYNRHAMESNKRRWDPMQRQFCSLLPVVSLNTAHLRFVNLTHWHYRQSAENWKEPNAAYAEEIWNHSAILDKKLNFCQISEPRILPPEIQRICLCLSSAAF